MHSSICDVGKNRICKGVAFELQMLHSRKRIYKLALRILGNASDAEDVTQETFLSAWKHSAANESIRSFDSWITRIALNRCTDLKRRSWRAPMSLDTALFDKNRQETSLHEIGDSTNDPAVRMFAGEIDERLLDSIARLPDAYRQCLLLRAERSYEEVAHLLHCPVGTVRSRLHRARVFIRQALDSGKYSEVPVV